MVLLTAAARRRPITAHVLPAIQKISWKSPTHQHIRYDFYHMFPYACASWCFTLVSPTWQASEKWAFEPTLSQGLPDGPSPLWANVWSKSIMRWSFIEYHLRAYLDLQGIYIYINYENESNQLKPTTSILFHHVFKYLTLNHIKPTFRMSNSNKKKSTIYDRLDPLTRSPCTFLGWLSSWKQNHRGKARDLDPFHLQKSGPKSGTGALVR